VVALGPHAYAYQHPDVDKVAFTGSTAAGRQIAEVCGRLLRPASLEYAAMISGLGRLAGWPQASTRCLRVSIGTVRQILTL